MVMLNRSRKGAQTARALLRRTAGPPVRKVASKSCECKRCGSTDWNWVQTVTILVKTAEDTATVGEVPEAEYRCARCGRKATIADVEAISETQAGATAVDLCVGGSDA